MARKSKLKTKLHLMGFAIASCFAVAGHALPVAPAVVNGAASFNQAGNVLNIANSNGAIINWQGFSIAQGEAVKFLQSAASSSVLNRVLAANPSLIYGNLSSNGRVWLVNPAGILVGPTGRIDTAGFVASTLPISNQDFLANKLTFSASTQPAAGVVNQGVITTPEGGSVYLIGATVENHGLIQTPGGETILAAGKTVQFVDTATPGVKVEITGDGQTTNLGQIVADAGRIGLVGSMVRNSGTLNASSVVREGGKVFLRANQDSYVDGQGRIVTTGTKGGQVEVLGDRVALTDEASIDASGVSGGGTVLIGGDYQGRNAAVQNSRITFFGSQASIKADATSLGDGGKVILWADDTTRAYGSISAQGGWVGGNGGFVETSGKQYLDLGNVNVSAAARSGVGRNGTWLLDPTNIQIIHSTVAAESGISYGSGIFQPNPVDSTAPLSSTISDFTLNAAINGDTNVEITTASGNLNLAAYGDITIQSNVAIAKTTGTATSLTLSADRDIHVQGAFSNNVSPFTVVLNASGGVYTDATNTLSIDGGSNGLVFQVNGGKTWTNNGTIGLSGNAQIHLFDGTSPATLVNSGVINLNSSNGWAIYSQSGLQNGVFTNNGTLNVNSGISFEAQFNQGSTGVTNLNDSTTLSLQNLGTVGGYVNLGATPSGGAYLWVSEDHGSAATFLNTMISQQGSTGGIKIGGSASYGGNVPVTFQGVNAIGNVNYGVGLVLDSKALMKVTGTNWFSSLAYANSRSTTAGQLSEINNGILAMYGSNIAGSGDFVIPDGVGFVGDVGIFARGNLSTTVNGIYHTGTGSVSLVAGWDGVTPDIFSSASSTPGVGDLSITHQLLVSNGSLYLQAGNSINLASGTNVTVTGSNPEIRMTVAATNGLFNGAGASITQVDNLADEISYAMSIQADRITLPTITVPDGGGVRVAPFSPNRNVSLGGADSTMQLGLSAGELASISASGTATYGGAWLEISPINGVSNVSIDALISLNSTVKGLFFNTNGDIQQSAGNTLSVSNVVIGQANNVLLNADNNVNYLGVGTMTGTLAFRSIASTLNLGYVSLAGANLSGLSNSQPALDISTPNTLMLNSSLNVAHGGIKLQAATINVNPANSVQNSIQAYGNIDLLTPVTSGVITHGIYGADIQSTTGAITLQGNSINTGGSIGSLSDVNIDFDGDLTINNTIYSGSQVNIHVYGGPGSLSIPTQVSGTNGTGNLINGMASGPNIVAPRAFLWAAYDIGSASKPITTQVSQLQVQSDYGGAYVANAGNLVLFGQNKVASDLALDVSGSLGMGAMFNGVIANGLWLKATGNIDLWGTAAQFSALSSSGGIRYHDNGSALALVTNSWWTSGTKALQAGGAFAPYSAGDLPESIEISSTNAISINGSVQGSAGSNAEFRAPSLSIASAVTLSGTAELGFRSDQLTLPSAFTANASNVMGFSTYTAGRQMALYNGTAPACVTSFSCLGVNLGLLKTAVYTPLLAFGHSYKDNIASGDLTLYSALDGTTLPSSVSTVGLLSGGTINQNGQTIAVQNLGLEVAGNVTLNTSVDAVAASVLGSLALINSKALTIGTIGPANDLVGIVSGGPLSITTNAGNLTNGSGIFSGGSVLLKALAGNVINNPPGITTNNSDVELNASGSISTALINAGTGKVKLAAYGGGVIDLDGAASNIFGSLLVLDVNGNTDIGTQVGKLAANTHGKNLRITQQGNLLLDKVDLGTTGDLDLTVGGTLNSGLATGVTDYNIVGNNARIAASSMDLSTQLAAADLSSSGNIVLREADALALKAQASQGDITVKTGGDLSLAGLVSSPGKVSLFSGGNLQQGGLATTTVEAKELAFSAAAEVDLRTKVHMLSGSISGAASDMTIWNDGALSLGKLTQPGTSTGNIQVDNVGAITVLAGATISTDAGNITLRAHSPITVNGTISGGSIVLVANTTAGTTGLDNITLNGVLSAIKNGGGISLQAGSSIFQNANLLTLGGSVILVAKAGNIQMASGTSTSTSGGTISYNANAGNIVLSVLNAGASGLLYVDASGKVSQVAGLTGPSLIGSSLSLKAASANLTTKVSLMDADIAGSFSIVDAQTGQVLSDVVVVVDPTTSSTTTNDTVNQVVNTVTSATKQTSPDRETEVVVVTPSMLANNAKTSNGDQTIGGEEGTFGSNGQKKNKTEDDEPNPNDKNKNDVKKDQPKKVAACTT